MNIDFINIFILLQVGNATGNSYVNITGNYFNNSKEAAIEVESSWRHNQGLLWLQIGHNTFISNDKVGIKMSPALNMDATIEYNWFRFHKFGCIKIKSFLEEEFNILPVNMLIQHNHFYENQGTYVVSIGLSPYSDVQHLMFTRNFLKNNRVQEPFGNDFHGSRLIPRSRVAAVLVVSSSNVKVYRNILHNEDSKYEIGSHLEDQSKIINCTYNWLGSGVESVIFEKLFHR